MLRHEPHLRTLGRVRGGYIEANEYGGVVFDMSTSSETRTLSQVLRSGEIWGLEALPSEVTRVRGLPLPYLYETFSGALSSYFQFATQHLKLKPPFTVILGISDIKQFGIIWDYGRTRGNCFDPEIVAERELASDSDIHEIVSFFLDEVSRTCGVSQ